MITSSYALWVEEAVEVQNDTLVNTLHIHLTFLPKQTAMG